METKSEQIKLVAKYMGHEIIEQNDSVSEYPLVKLSATTYLQPARYDSSWNWLMLVLNKISNKDGYVLVMAQGYSYWTDNMGNNPLEIDFRGYENIQNIFEAVVKLLKFLENERI